MEKFVGISEKHQANGFIAGLYIPGKEFHKGQLWVQEEEQHFPFTLSGLLVPWIKKNREVLQVKTLYQVWPSQLREANNQLAFHAIKVCPSAETFRLSDWFSIRGQLWDWDEKNRLLRMKINRNPGSPQRKSKRHSFYLVVKGSLPCHKCRGDLWEMQCSREENDFIVSNPIKIKPINVAPHPTRKQQPLRPMVTHRGSSVGRVGAIPLHSGL